MYKIKLPVGCVISLSSDTPVNVGTAMENFRLFQENAQIIMMATIVLERELDAVILDRTFEGETGARLRFFSDNILASEWFTFSAKRRLVEQIVNEQERLQGLDKSKLSELFKKVMNYRNAMAHGTFIDKSGGSYLSFFAGSPQEKLLSEAYWREIEEVFKQTNELMRKISTKENGAPAKSDAGHPNPG